MIDQTHIAHFFGSLPIFYVIFCSLPIFYVSLQNSGAVATWTKRWWRCRIFTFPILFCDENTKVGTIAMSFPTKVKFA